MTIYRLALAEVNGHNNFCGLVGGWPQPWTLALSNDNDYGKEGDSFVYVVQFKDPVLDWI